MTRNRTNARSGFSRIDALIVMCVIGLALALSLMVDTTFNKGKMFADLREWADVKRAEYARSLGEVTSDRLIEIASGNLHSDEDRMMVVIGCGGLAFVLVGALGLSVYKRRLAARDLPKPGLRYSRNDVYRAGEQRIRDRLV